VSRQPRHRYAADLPCGLPGLLNYTARKFPPLNHTAGRTAPGPHPPGSSRCQDQGRNNAGSSRTPFRHARRTRPIWQYWIRPGFVGAAPTLPGTTRIRLPPASPPCYDKAEAKVSHPHSNNSASRRKVDA
jgi:hypothetical protein